MQHYIESFTRVELYTTLFVDTRTATKQVMVLESSYENFAVAKSQATINATVNQGGITDNILSYVVSHRRFVKIQIQHA